MDSDSFRIWVEIDLLVPVVTGGNSNCGKTNWMIMLWNSISRKFWVCYSSNYENCSSVLARRGDSSLQPGLGSQLSHLTQSWDFTRNHDLGLIAHLCFKSGKLTVIPSFPRHKQTNNTMPAAAVPFVITFGYKDFIQGPNRRLAKCKIGESK